jgi:ABC-2 type transport system ATP-binding protein
MDITVDNVYKKFQGEFVLNGVSLSIKSSDKIAMLGPNGAGKTTLIRAMLGFYHIDKGSISIDNLDPIKNRVEVLKRASFIPQLPPPIKLTISELVEYISQSSGIKKEKIFQEASLMDLDLNKNLKKPFFKLSGGMKQKLLIAIALAKKSNLLIFDEPTANLDPKARESFYKLLSTLNKDTTTIFITHRLDEIKNLINRKIYMELGKVVEDEKI